MDVLVKESCSRPDSINLGMEANSPEDIQTKDSFNDSTVVQMFNALRALTTNFFFSVILDTLPMVTKNRT